jgi:hypothetical protein
MVICAVLIAVIILKCLDLVEVIEFFFFELNVENVDGYTPA